MEFLSEHCRNDCAGNHASGSDTHNDIGIVFSRHLEGERARQLAEQRPFDVEDSICRIDGLLAG